MTDHEHELVQLREQLAQARSELRAAEAHIVQQGVHVAQIQVQVHELQRCFETLCAIDTRNPLGSRVIMGDA